MKTFAEVMDTLSSMNNGGRNFQEEVNKHFETISKNEKYNERFNEMFADFMKEIHFVGTLSKLASLTDSEEKRQIENTLGNLTKATVQEYFHKLFILGYTHGLEHFRKDLVREELSAQVGEKIPEHVWKEFGL